MPQQSLPGLLSRHRRLAHLSLLVLVTALVFSNTLENDYHLDSVYRVKNNSEIDHFWPPGRFFTDVRTGSTIPQIAEYRPFMPLSHALNSEISRATGTSRLAGFHAGNIAIHIGSAILLYFLFELLLVQSGTTLARSSRQERFSAIAFAAALLFAVHPISGSSVNYIAGRDLLLMVFFLLAALLVYVRMRGRGDSVPGWLACLLLVSMSILSKQAAIIFFAVVFLYEWIFRGARLRDGRLWARTVLAGLPTVGYFLLRWLWVNKQGQGDSLRLPVDPYFPFTMAKAHVFYYLRNVAWPFEMRALAKFDRVDTFLDPGALIGIVFIAATLTLAWLCRRKHPLVAFAILAYWLLFALEGSIFPFLYVVTDYRQYLPFAFLSLIISLLCFSLRPRALALALLAGLVVYFAVSSHFINRHWKTEESFWRQSVTHGAIALAHNNYAMSVASRDPELAEQHYREALRQNPSHIYANINLALLYLRGKRQYEGLKMLQQTAQRNPGWALSHYWYAYGLRLANRKSESLSEYVQAADLDPRNLQYQLEAARALQVSGDHGASIPYLERIMKINPGYGQAGFMLGFALQKSGRSQDAIRAYEDFLAGHPDNVQANFNLAYALMLQDRCDAAIERFIKTLSLQPEYREVHLHLSRCYASLGEQALADEHARLYGESN